MICQVTDADAEVVLVSHKEKELCCLLEEAGSRGVVDTACSKSAAGLDWIDRYVSAISPSLAEELIVLPSTKMYQFGGGEKRPSKDMLRIPAILGDKKIDITLEIVDADIPLLIGSNSLKASGAILNFQNNTATFFGEEVQMVEVGTGHFCVNLLCEHIETHVNEVADRDVIVW